GRRAPLATLAALGHRDGAERGVPAIAAIGYSNRAAQAHGDSHRADPREIHEGDDASAGATTATRAVLTRGVSATGAACSLRDDNGSFGVRGLGVGAARWEHLHVEEAEGERGLQQCQERAMLDLLMVRALLIVEGPQVEVCGRV